MTDFSQAYECGCVVSGKGFAPEMCPNHKRPKELNLGRTILIHLRAKDSSDFNDD